MKKENVGASVERSTLIGETIGVKGNSPYDEMVIDEIAPLEAAMVGGVEIWQTDQLVVVGTEESAS